MSSTILKTAITAAMLLLFATHAQAIPISTCGATCNGPCQLTQNISCAAGQTGVILTTGASLDMKGFDIRCDVAPGDQCNTAVIVTGGGPGTSVFSSQSLDSSDPPARIVGPWFGAGVNCQGFASTRVTGITLHGTFTGFAAIAQCRIVDSNIIAGVSLPGTDLFTDSYPVFTPVGISYSSSALISGNYIDGCVTGIKRLIGGIANGSQVTFNTINFRNHKPGAPPTASDGFGIDLSTSTQRTATVRNNLVIGDNNNAVMNVTPGNTTISFDNNVCKLGLAKCSQCVALGYCAASATVTSP